MSARHQAAQRDREARRRGAWAAGAEAPGWNVADVQSQARCSGRLRAWSWPCRQAPDEPGRGDRHQGITLFTAGGNLAGRTRAPSKGASPGPAEMTDGKADTAGYLIKGAPTWLEVDLDQPATLAGVELVVAQERPAVTIHEVWVTTADGQFRGMHTFVGPTTDNQTLSVHFDAPVANAKTVRIATTQVAARGADRLARAPLPRSLNSSAQAAGRSPEPFPANAPCCIEGGAITIVPTGDAPSQ